MIWSLLIKLIEIIINMLKNFILFICKLISQPYFWRELFYFLGVLMFTFIILEIICPVIVAPAKDYTLLILFGLVTHACVAAVPVR